jgi:hypothetical protein
MNDEVIHVHQSRRPASLPWLAMSCPVCPPCARALTTYLHYSKRVARDFRSVVPVVGRAANDAVASWPRITDPSVRQDGFSGRTGLDTCGELITYTCVWKVLWKWKWFFSLPLGRARIYRYEVLTTTD